MVRFSFLICCFAVSLMSIGCCAPMGPGCGMGCSDCDGYGSGSTITQGPLDGLRQMKRSLVCGGGCGEAYIGEWISTPPDATDPCCGDQWVGGATKCRPFCWEPGSLLGGLGLYGGRYCSGAESSAPCGCGIDACDGGCGFADGGYVETGHSYSVGGGCSSGNCGGGSGCSTCDARSSRMTSQMAQGMPASDRITRSASLRNMDQRVKQIRR